VEAHHVAGLWNKSQLVYYLAMHREDFSDSNRYQEIV
jgi:hypothetical protein